MLAPCPNSCSLVQTSCPFLTIHEDATKILMISAREHSVYSRWDKTHHRALSPYGRAMADAVRAHLRKSQQKARVLMLGLGGGGRVARRLRRALRLSRDRPGARRDGGGHR